MADLLDTLLVIYEILLFGRIILSWFPLGPGSPMTSVYSFLYTVTEPVLGPIRRIMPSMGGLDLSPIIVFFGIQILRSALRG